MLCPFTTILCQYRDTYVTLFLKAFRSSMLLRKAYWKTEIGNYVQIAATLLHSYCCLISAITMTEWHLFYTKCSGDIEIRTLDSKLLTYLNFRLMAEIYYNTLIVYWTAGKTFKTSFVLIVWNNSESETSATTQLKKKKGAKFDIGNRYKNCWQILFWFLCWRPVLFWGVSQKSPLPPKNNTSSRWRERRGAPSLIWLFRLADRQTGATRYSSLYEDWTEL